MKKVLIVEPHADDALLSMYSVMRDYMIQCSSSKNIEVSLLSISNPIRGSQKLTEYLGFNSRYLGSEDLGKIFKLGSILNCTSYEEYSEEVIKLAEKNGGRIYGKINDIKSYYGLLKFTDFNYEPVDFDEVYCPLGIKHIDHVITRLAIDSLFVNKHSNSKVIYYAEYPYAYRRYGTKQLFNCCKDYDTNPIILNNDLLTEKRDLMSSFYPKEKFFIWNDIKPPRLEIFLTRKKIINECPDSLSS